MVAEAILRWGFGVALNIECLKYHEDEGGKKAKD